MNESPDFRQIAGVLLARVTDAGERGLLAEVNTVAEQLRQVWNARGDADGQALKAELQRALAKQEQGVTINLEAMIKALDVPETPTTMTERTVGPIGVAVVGCPERCPTCGGQLAPAFGENVVEGIRRPVIDPTLARCRDCGTSYPVTQPANERG